MSISKNQPLVSVVIPTHNSVKYICQAIESVLRQTYANYEIIVVDDGSDDNTNKIFQLHTNPIKYFYQENQGVSVARNQGLYHSQGELIVFLDADDFMLPHKLDQQVRCFQSYPHAGIIHSGWHLVNQYGEFLANIEPWQKIPQLNLETWLRWKPVIPGPMMFSREWLNCVGGFDPALKYAEDKDLIFRLGLGGCETVWLRQPTICYRQHSSSKKRRNILEVLKTQKYVLESFLARPDIPENIRKIEDEIRYYTLLWIAWSAYNYGHFTEMKAYLQESLNYTSDVGIKVIVNWIENFKKFSSAKGEILDTYSITSSIEWKQAIRQALKLNFLSSLTHKTR
ncbi:MAG: glycosyltransferase family A protein [Trichodesmium sp. MO_231.B1]|nr:glycosyltransferase family A protein [Trichodesmium sp. MO_231.B1]